MLIAFLIMASSIYLSATEVQHIRLKGDTLSFVDSSGTQTKTLTVGLPEHGWYIWYKKGTGGHYRQAEVAADRQAAIVIDTPGENKNTTATLYDVRGRKLCSVKGGRHKMFWYTIAISPASRLFAITKQPTCMPDSECEVIENLKLEPGEAPDGLLVYSYECDLKFRSDLIDDMQRFSPGGRYLIFNRTLVDLKLKGIVEPPKRYRFTGLARDGIVEFCHEVLLQGCTTFKE